VGKILYKQGRIPEFVIKEEGEKSLRSGERRKIKEYFKIMGIFRAWGGKTI